MSSKCCDISSGKLDREIVIQALTRVPDGQAGYTESWADHATVFAWIKPMSAFQISQSEQLQHRVTHKIVIRYLSTLTAEMRIVFGTRVFGIEGFRDLEERNEWHEITAEEGRPS